MYKILRSCFYLALVIFLLSGCASLDKAKSLYKEGDRDKALKMAEKFLDDKDDNTRLKAVNLIGEIGGKEAGNILIKPLDDPSLKVKNASIRHIGRLRHVPASEKLVEMSLEAKGQTVEEIGRAVRGIGSPAMDILAKKYSSASDPKTLSQYKEVILETGPSMTPSITKNMVGKSTFQNKTTFEILLAFKNPKVASHMLNDIDNEEIGDMVVKGLSKLGRMAVIPVLSKLKQITRRPGMVNVKERLIQILANLKDNRSIEILEKLTSSDESERVRNAANSALIKIRNF